MICDDNDAYRRLLTLLLEIDGDVEIVGEASNGAEAIDRVAEMAPDVLLLDVAMPVQDGIAALPQILEERPGLNIIMLSGFSSPEIRAEAERAGATQFIEKGMDISTVTDAVRSIAAGRPA